MADVVDGLKTAYLESSQAAMQKTALGVAVQVGLMTAISVLTLFCFSLFRPRQSKVYAPKLMYHVPPPKDPRDDPDYEPPPPTISSGFFAWLSPVIHLKEQEMITNIGLDATTFLRFTRMLLYVFCACAIPGVVLIVGFAVWNLQNVKFADRKNVLSMFTIQNVSGIWVWVAVAMSYIYVFIALGFIWHNWKAMVLLRYQWFRSPAYQTKIYSRTLMVTQIPKSFRSDEGLRSLMSQLPVDGIKIDQEIDCTTVGRRLGDFPTLIHDHNEAVKDLEKTLVKYLKHGKMAKTRPTIRKGGFMGIGGEKVDKIDYYAKQVKFLRDKVEQRREVIDSLLRKERRERKLRGRKGQAGTRVEGENYGFVTFKTIADAHRIARTHGGKVPALGGARLQLAPMPNDILWQNISKEPAEIASLRVIGFFLIGIVCFFNTIPVTIIAFMSNLASLVTVVPALNAWKDSATWGWAFVVVSGILPPMIQAAFGYFLPIVVRKIGKYQGIPTRTQLDRAVTARYFFFMIFMYLIILVLIGLIFNLINEVVIVIGEHRSASEIWHQVRELPEKVQAAYVSVSTYWLSWLPLRGFLVIYDIIQLIKLAMVSWRRLMFSYTPRDIRDLTKPPPFAYHVYGVNMLMIAAVGMFYAPLAPLVTIGAALVFWFSVIVFKYQLLYVYVSRAESGGRMWNVWVNRFLWCCFLMQGMMVMTTGFIRGRWIDCFAAVPPVIIIIVFKIWITFTLEKQFKFYVPTPQEAEQQRQQAMNEKRTKHSEMERRFLNPALQRDKLYTIMVHKKQEALSREVLSPYPWFRDNDVHIKGVREENLEYDPERDGPADGTQKADWDARSIDSASALNMFGDGTGSGSGYSTPMLQTAAQSQQSFHPGYNGSEDLAPPLVNRAYPGPRSEDGRAPLLDPWQQQQSVAHANASPSYPPLSRTVTGSSMGTMGGPPLSRVPTGDMFGRESPAAYGAPSAYPQRPIPVRQGSSYDSSGPATQQPSYGSSPPISRPPSGYDAYAAYAQYGAPVSRADSQGSDQALALSASPPRQYGSSPPRAPAPGYSSPPRGQGYDGQGYGGQGYGGQGYGGQGGYGYGPRQ